MAEAFPCMLLRRKTTMAEQLDAGKGTQYKEAVDEK